MDYDIATAIIFYWYKRRVLSSGKKLTRGSLQVSKPKPLHPNFNDNVPYLLIGDEGFALSEHLMIPFGGTHLDRRKRISNYRLTMARRPLDTAV
ncbi:hypothetical protein QE152_g15197 [Popillia japonica]|uniref:DDE Tnp4 domain-containing protein n=1 Tax=Popillia japonica TaxID=7064 RepID=A0AAW1L6V2_POPJA